MSEFEQLFPKEFHASPGVEDWRVLFYGAHVFYRTSSFDQAAEFVCRHRRSGSDSGP